MTHVIVAMCYPYRRQYDTSVKRRHDIEGCRSLVARSDKAHDGNLSRPISCVICIIAKVSLFVC